MSRRASRSCCWPPRRAGAGRTGPSTTWPWPTRPGRTRFRRATARLPDAPVYHGDFTTAGGRRVAERIIAAGRVPRALVCANDQTAIGVMAALQQAGLSVPGDVAVTGFDGIMLGRHLHP